MKFVARDKVPLNRDVFETQAKEVTEALLIALNMYLTARDKVPNAAVMMGLCVAISTHLSGIPKEHRDLEVRLMKKMFATTMDTLAAYDE
jgi:hypothetical protein